MLGCLLPHELIAMLESSFLSTSYCPTVAVSLSWQGHVVLYCRAVSDHTVAYQGGNTARGAMWCWVDGRSGQVDNANLL